MVNFAHVNVVLSLLTLLHTTHVTSATGRTLNITMIHDDLEELKLLIVHNLDVYDFLDILEIDLAELVNILEEQVEENYARLHAAVR